MKSTIPLLTLAGLGTTHAALFSSGELDYGVILEETQPGVFEFELEAHAVRGVIDGTTITDPDGEEFESDALDVLLRPNQSNPVMIVMNDIPAAGVSTGDSLWSLPQSEIAGVPFVALASEELIAADWSTSITFTLGNVISPSGSGTFSMWESPALPGGSATFYFSSTNAGATVDNNRFVSDFGHNHVNWGFTETGEWTVELIATGTHNTLGDLEARGNLVFQVVPEPSTSLLFSLCSLGLLIQRRRK